MGDYISGYHDLMRLTHEINHHNTHFLPFWKSAIRCQGWNLLFITSYSLAPEATSHKPWPPRLQFFSEELYYHSNQVCSPKSITQSFNIFLSITLGFSTLEILIRKLEYPSVCLYRFSIQIWCTKFWLWFFSIQFHLFPDYCWHVTQ